MKTLGKIYHLTVLNSHSHFTHSYIGELSENQEGVLIEIKEWMSKSQISQNPWHTTDFFILRFCRARKFDTEQTKQMLENFFQIRKDLDVDKILTVSSLIFKECHNPLSQNPCTKPSLFLSF